MKIGDEFTLWFPDGLAADDFNGLRVRVTAIRHHRDGHANVDCTILDDNLTRKIHVQEQNLEAPQKRII